MPFIQRSLEPINVSRVEVEKGISNELECVTNHTLSNIILQLSSLSKHAEDLFTELSQEVENFTGRTRQLQSRIDHLQDKVTKLDAAGEIVSIHEIHLRKPYKSSTQHDQQVVSRSTIPRGILKVYSQCEPTPALDKLNQYREDGKDSAKFYTDPGYFFELWFQDIQKDIENRKTELKAKRKRARPKSETKKKTPRQVQTRKERFANMAKGVEYADPVELGIQQANQPRPESLSVKQPDSNNVSVDRRNSRPKTANGPHYSQDMSRQSDINSYPSNEIQHGHPAAHMAHNQLSPQQNRVSSRASSSSIGQMRPAQPPPAPPSLVNTVHRQDAGKQSPARDSLPPPPPPPPGEDPNQKHYTPSPPMNKRPTQHATRQSPGRHIEAGELPPPPPPPPISPEQNLPPPPPPPPTDTGMSPPPPPPPPPPAPTGVMMNGYDGSSISSDSSLGTQITNSPSLKPTPKKPEPIIDDRSNLLAQIRLGTHKEKLRKVEEREVERSNRAPGGNFDVHSIMNRAFEMRRKVIEDSEEEASSSGDEWD